MNEIHKASIVFVSGQINKNNIPCMYNARERFQSYGETTCSGKKSNVTVLPTKNVLEKMEYPQGYSSSGFFTECLEHHCIIIFFFFELLHAPR